MTEEKQEIPKGAARCRYCEDFVGAWALHNQKPRLFPIEKDSTGSYKLDYRGRVIANTSGGSPHSCSKYPAKNPPGKQGESKGESNGEQQGESQQETGGGRPTEQDFVELAQKIMGNGEGSGQDSQDQKMSLDKILAKAVEPHLKLGTDEKKVKEIAKAVADEKVKPLHDMLADLEKKVAPEPAELTIKLVKPDDSEVKVKGHRHKDWPRLLELCRRRIAVLLIGPPGAGKSEALRQVSEALELPYHELVLGPTDTASKAVGFFDAQGRIVATEYRKAWVDGGVLHVEEIDNASAAILTTLNSMWASGFATFPDGSFPKHENFILVASANTDLRGGDVNHSQRRPLDVATTDRFFRFRWVYDEKLEEKLALGINPDAKPWVQWIKKVRKHAAEYHPHLVVSPRAAMRGAELLLTGLFSPDEIAAGTVFIGGCDKDTVAKILSKCPLPTPQA